MKNNYEQLINAASKKLGTSPEILREKLESGDLKTLSSGLSKADKEKLRMVLKNEELMDKLKKASSPEDVVNILQKK